MIKTSLLENNKVQSLEKKQKLTPLQEIFHKDFLDKIPMQYRASWPVDKLNWWSRPDEYNFILQSSESLKSVSQVKMLEFGPGISFITSHMKRMYNSTDYMITDIDRSVQKFWQETHGLQNINVSDIREGSLDFIFSVSVLEHMDNPICLIQDLVTKLKTGGKLAVTMDIDIGAAKKSNLGLSIKDLNELLSVLGDNAALYKIENFTNRLRPPYFWTFSWRKLNLRQILRMLKANVKSQNRDNIAVIFIEFTKIDA